MKNVRKNLKKIVSMGLILTTFATTVYASPYHTYERFYKNISTSRTSSSDSFPSSISYSDGEGYNGSYTKDGGSYVISGQAPIGKRVSITKEYTSSNYPSSISHNDGQYSGALSVSNVTNDTKTKTVSGSASIRENFNKKCLVGGSAQYNMNYDPAKFNYNNTSTWEYHEVGTSWSSEFSVAIGGSSSSAYFSTSFSGTSLVSASYNDGTYSGSVSISSNGVSTSRFTEYRLNPNNGYTPPNTGQECLVRTDTHRYSMSGTVTAQSYKVTYEGYVYTPDTRTWKQDYSGVAEKVIVHTLDSIISISSPVAMEQGKNYDISITAKNTGNRIWSKSEKICLGKIEDGTFPWEDRLQLPEGVVIKPGQSYTWTVNVTAPMVTGEYNLKVQTLEDNLLKDNWFGNVASKNILVYDLNAIGDGLQIKKYDYFDGKNTYWVKANSPVEIYSDGYFDSRTGLYPKTNEILMSDKISLKSSLSGSQIVGNSETDLSNFNTTNKATQGYKDSKNYLYSTFNFNTATGSKDTSYVLKYRSIYDNAPNFITSSKILGVDVTAPQGTVDIDDSVEGELTTKIYDMIEKGSGIKKLWIEYTSDKNSTPMKKELIQSNGKYEDFFSIHNNYGKDCEYVNVLIKAIDNVGNEGTLYNEKVYTFNVEASISRMRDPKDPMKFMSGDSGILKINTKGYVEKLEITFPYEMSALDNTLDRTITLDPKSKDTVEIKFQIPLDTKKGEYNIQVKAFKKDKEKEAYPKFKVLGRLTEEFRTVILKN